MSTAFKLVFKIVSKSSSSISKMGVGELIPGPLIRMSIFPDLANTVSSNSWLEDLELTSTFWKYAVLPADFI
jgi:hypothetical protein